MSGFVLEICLFNKNTTHTCGVVSDTAVTDSVSYEEIVFRKMWTKSVSVLRIQICPATTYLTVLGFKYYTAKCTVRCK